MHVINKQEKISNVYVQGHLKKKKSGIGLGMV